MSGENIGEYFEQRERLRGGMESLPPRDRFFSDSIAKRIETYLDGLPADFEGKITMKTNGKDKLEITAKAGQEEDDDDAFEGEITMKTSGAWEITLRARTEDES